MSSTGRQPLVLNRNSLVGTLPEIRVKIYELVLSTTVLTYGIERENQKKPEAERTVNQWRLRHRLPLLLICKQIYSEITPLLLSSIIFKFDNAWSENMIFSQHLTSILSIPFNIKHLVLHTGLAVNLVKELRDKGFPEAEDITLLGRGRITSSFKGEDGVWGINISNGWGGYVIKIDEMNELKSLPCDIVAQFNLFHDGQVTLARFSMSDSGELDFTWTEVWKDKAIWPTE